MRRTPRLFGLGLAAILLACAPPAAETADAEAMEAESAETALRETVANMLAAWEVEDVATIETFYSEDVMQIPPDRPVESDRASLMAEIAMLPEQGDYSLHAEIEDLQISGSLAWTLIDYSDVMTPEDGGEAGTSTGRWAILWTRDADGQWKISREIWNHPPGGAPGG